MKTPPLLLAVSLFVIGCKQDDEGTGLPHDAEVRKTMAGVWSVHLDSPNGGFFESVTSVKPNGHYLAQITIRRSNGTVNIDFEGDFEVKNNVLIDRITRDTQTNAEALPRTSRAQIIRVTESEIAVRYEGTDNETVFRRKVR
jgi:hypothetical protein